MGISALINAEDSEDSEHAEHPEDSEDAEAAEHAGCLKAEIRNIHGI